MKDEFCGLLDPSGFVPRAVCGQWTWWEIALNNTSDLLIALAYVLIPVILFYFTRKRRDLPFSWMFLVFGAFIITCGCTHLLEIVLFYYPVYHLAGWLKALTALASWAAVFCLVKVVPAALTLRSPAELEREIESRQAAEALLAEKNRRLEDAEQLKDQFLANVSHELRTPLTLILSPTESLLASNELSPPQETSLTLIRSNALRLLRQVDDLLDYSKYQSGKLEVHREATEVTALCRQLVESFQPVAGQKSLSLEFTADREETRWLDRYLFERILFNLLSNALKYARSRVEVILNYQGDQMTLEVYDDGPGVADEDRQIIFERFRQSGVRDRASGTGLGLALVREFSSVLGGQAELAQGPGARFVVQILAPIAAVPTQPLVSNPPQPLEAEWQVTVEPQDLPRLLLAEDEPELGSYLALVLRGIVEVRIVRDGRLALEALQAWRPDIVLSDVMMPGLSGFELCRQIKMDPRWSGLPVLLLTALTHREALLEGWEAGADEFLFKPFHPTELVTRVRTLLSLSVARQALEVELQGKNAELEAKIAEKTAQLSLSLKHAEAANEAKTRFLGNLSHELLTPLTGVLALTDLALADDPSPSVAARLQGIQESATNLDARLKDLVELCQLESGHLRIRPAPFNLRAMLTGLHGSLISQAADQGLAWEMTLRGPDPWWVEGDSTRIRHVVLNLLHNALKFTKAGFVKLEVTENLKFSVADSGTGIHLDYQKRILQRFVQRDDSLKKSHQGLGLGLAICSELLALMGSELRLESFLGQGSKFSFQLVLPSASPPPDPPQAQSAHYTILLVEDHPLNRAALKLMLERAGYRVLAAESGQTGLDLIREQEVDLAILDLQLPDMDGLEIAARLRSTHPELPLLALTAHVGEEWRKRCLEAGFRAYLTKPTTSEELTRKIAELFGRKPKA